MINIINPTTEKIFNQTKVLWDSLTKENTQLDPFDSDFLKTFPLHEIADTTHSTIAIYNYHEFIPEYITENVQEILGFSKEDYLSQGSKLLFSFLHPHHIDFPLITSKQIEFVFKSLEPNKSNNILATCCGPMFNHPQKGTIRLLIQQYFVLPENNQIPLRAISTIQDVSHFMKGDSYFFRIIFGDKYQNIFIYHSNIDYDNKASFQKDIFSNREMEIFQLIVQGKNTDEIAEILSISRNTVNNHRQNLLDRMGVKDTTSLIELARICHII